MAQIGITVNEFGRKQGVLMEAMEDVLDFNFMD